MNATPIFPPRTPEPLGTTRRQDRWWLEPLLNFIGFTTFVGYSLWVTFMPVGPHGPSYEWPHLSSLGWTYLSPFYSPLFGPRWWHFSPAILVLWMPLGFRATCYYYRKMYYRTYFADPPACAVSDTKFWQERPGSYKGETAFPWILQNVHRWFLYLASYVLVVLWIDAFRSIFFRDPAGQPGLHFGVGSAILLANAALLSAYTFGCHALRHLVGGNVDCWSCSRLGRVRHRFWEAVSRLNEHHMMWAWVSMIFVGLSDLYIRLLAMNNVPFTRFPWL